MCALIGLNFSVIPPVYALDHPDPTTAIFAFCRLQYYFRHAFNQMMRTFFIFACADRYAISSTNLRIRSFSRYQIAQWVILCVPVFWLSLAIFPTMLRTIENGSCEGYEGLATIVLATYITVFVGFAPLFVMIIFGLLMLMNLKNSRARVQPITCIGPATHRLRKRDREMMRMLFIEVMCYICTTAPLAVDRLYISATQTAIKSNERLQIESFITYLTGTFLLYINNGLSFWIYITTSRTFRLEFQNLLIKCCTWITGKQIPLNLIN
jgi:hypothetical protein